MLELYFERIDAQNNGAPIAITDIGVEDGGAYIKVRRMFTPEYERQIQELKSIKYSAFTSERDMDMQDILTDWLCEHGVTGWHGIKEPGADEDLKFTMENCKRILKSPAYISLVNKLVTEASNREAYLAMTIDYIEESLGKKLKEM